MFSLFEAMSAIEMMDPKMDAGMACNRVSRRVLNLQDSIAAGVVKISCLSLQEMIGIIDDTTACLMSWLDGHSLAQTVFTNLYLHDPFVIQDKALKTFCLLILKTVEAFREFIVRAEVFEEEDFQPGVFNFRLDYDVTEGKICSMVREVEDDLSKKLKVLNKKYAVSNELDNNIHATNSSNSESSLQEEIKLIQGLHARFKTYRCLLSALSCIGKEKFIPRKDASTSNANLHSKNMTNGHHSSQDNLVIDCRKYLSQCQESVLVWRETINMGLKPLISEVEENHKKEPAGMASPADYPVIPGFEPLINQRLLPPTFPRYTKLKNRVQSVTEIESLINRLIHVIKVREVTDFHDALDFFDNFSRNEGGATCVLSRSVLQLAYVPQTNTTTSRDQFMDILKDTIYQFIRPPSLQLILSQNKSQSSNLNNNCKVRQTVDAFVTQSLRPMMSLLQIQGHNRARQREKLSLLLEEMTAFQSESESVDSFLNNIMSSSNSSQDILQVPSQSIHLGFFSTWVLYHIIRVMVQFTSSGFELELYSAHEYPYIYWYLYEFLYGWLISTITRASNMVLEQKTLAELNRAASMTGKNAKKINKVNKKKLMKEPKPHGKLLQVSQALQQLSGGLFKTTLAFKMQEKLKQPRHFNPSNSSTPFPAEKLRYEHRFMPFFAVMSPPVVSYEQYQEMINQTGITSSPQDLFITASRCFDEARKILEMISDPSQEVSFP